MQLGTYDNIDLSNLYMGLQIPVLDKEGAKTLPFNYSIVGFPNVQPGVWGQTSTNLSIPYPLFGGIGYSTGAVLCPSGSNQVWTATYWNFSYVDVAGAYSTFPTLISSSGTLGCGGSSATYRTASGLLTLSISVDSSFLMTYTLTDSNGVQTISNGTGGGFIKAGWTASTNFGLNAYLYDTNGNAQLTTACVNFDCTSGTTKPTYNSTVGGTTTDYHLTWTNKGKPAGLIKDIFGNSVSVSVTNLTGATQTGSGSYADASRDYSKPQVWTYTDTMNMNPLTVTNPALTDSNGVVLPTVQTAMTYKDNRGNTQNVYINQSHLAETTVQAPCIGSINGPVILGVNATIDGSGTIHGNSFGNTTPYTFFPTSVVYPDSSQIGLQYEMLPGDPSGNTSVTSVGIKNGLVTLSLGNTAALGVGSPITKLVASGGLSNPSITVTISGSNPWTVGMRGTIAFMSSPNMVWDGLPFTVLSKTSTTVTFYANYCTFFITCPTTLTVNETQGMLVSNYPTLTLSGLTNATFLNATSPASVSIGGHPFQVSVVVATSTSANFHSYSYPYPMSTVVLSNFLNSQFNITGTVTGGGSDQYGPYFTVSGSFTSGTYTEQGVGLPSTQTGTNFITYGFTHADYGPTSDSGTLTNAGSSQTTTGRLSQITLPTGGTIGYAYSGGTNNSGINCQDSSYATITRTTSDGMTTFSHSPTSWLQSVPASPGQAFEIYNFAGPYAYARAVGPWPWVPAYWQYPIVQGQVTAVQVTGTTNNYVVTVTFTNGLPPLIPGNSVFVYAPGSTIITSYGMQIASVTANTITSVAGPIATGTYNGSVSGYITTGCQYSGCTGGAFYGPTMPTGQWASLSGGGSPGSTTTVTDPAGNQTIYQFAGLREVDRQVFQGTPANAVLNSSFESGLTNWSAVSPIEVPVSGSVTCGYPWSSGCASYLDVGSTSQLLDPWSFNSSTGVLSIALGVGGTGGSGTTPATTTYVDSSPLIVGQGIVGGGSRYTAYLLTTPPSQFTVGATVDVEPNHTYGGLPTHVSGTHTIESVCSSCLPPNFTWTDDYAPTCDIAVQEGTVWTETPDGNGDGTFTFGGSTLIGPGMYVIESATQPTLNNRVGWATYGSSVISSVYGLPYWGQTTDNGYLGWSSCATYQDFPYETANAFAGVTVQTPNQATQSVGISYVTSTGSAPATYKATLSGSLPSGFAVGTQLMIAGVGGSNAAAPALDTCAPSDPDCPSASNLQGNKVFGYPITATTTTPPTVSWQSNNGPLNCTSTTCTGGTASVSVNNATYITNVSSVQNVQINGTWTTVVTFATAFPSVQSIEIGPFGTQFTFTGLTHATWLNGKVLRPTAWDGQTVLYFAPPSGAPEPYGPTSDTGSVSYIHGDSGPTVWGSDQLFISNMNVPNVPSGSQITGITFSINWYNNYVGGATLTAQITHNGVPVGTSKPCAMYFTCTFGSSTDLWGTSGLNYDSGFGIVLTASTGYSQTLTLCCENTYDNYTLTINAISNVHPLWTTTSSQFYLGAHSATVSSQAEAQLFSLTSSGSKFRAVNPGDIIQYGGYLLRTGGQGNLWYTCAFYDSTQTFISQCPYAGPISQNLIGNPSGQGIPAPGTWTYYQGTVVAPANGAYATYYVELHGSGNSNDTGGDSDISLTTVFADAATFIDLTTSGLLKEDVTCYNSTVLYVPGNGDPRNCANFPPVSMNSAITEVDSYSFTPGGLTGPSISTRTFDASGRPIDGKLYNGGQSNFNSDSIIAYGTYTGTLGTSASPSNCSALSNPALTRTVCYTATTDFAGNVLNEEVFQYDAYGNLTTKNRIDVPDAKNFITSYTYSSKGQLATTTVPNGTITTVNNTLCNSLLPSKMYDSTQSVSFTIDCTTGNVLTLTDANNQLWTYAYNDPLNRLTKFSSPMTTGTYTDSVAFTYGTKSIDTKMVFNSSNSVNESLQTFDGLGRPLLNQEAYSSSQFTTVQSAYNSVGALSGESIPFLSAAGTVGTGLTTSALTYDGLGRPLKYTSTNGQTVTYTYSGSDILVVIVAGVTLHNYELDALGNVVSVCEVTSLAGSGPCGQQTAKTGYLTTFSYDPLGRVVRMVKNAQSSTPHTTTFSYDGFGRIVSTTRPETGQLKYTWDTDALGTCPASPGNPVRIDDANGNVICATYDTHDRETIETYSGPNSSVTPSKYFVYDSSTTFTCPNPANQMGRLAEVYTGSPSAKLTDEGFCYSPRGELTDVFQTTPNSGGYFHTSATYWPDGSINTLSGVPGIAGSFTYTPSYAWTNQVTGPSSTNLVTGVTSTAGTIPSVVTFGTGDTDNFSLDTKGNFSGYSSIIGGTTASGTWTWNTNGTPKTLALTNPFNTTAPSQSCAYTWDPLLRVASFKCTNGSTNLWGQTFTYDQYGNVKKTVPTGFTGQKWNPAYVASNNQYSGTAYAYDADGRLLKDSINTYTWTVNGKIATLTNIATGVVTTYTYDALDQLVEESSSNASGHLQYVKSPAGKVATTHSTN
jgi:YD repeat-containing protein